MNRPSPSGSPPGYFLKVYANPYASLDRHGMPAGQTRHDPSVGRKGAVHFVGVDVERIIETDETRLPEGVTAQDNAMRHARQGGEAAFRQRIVAFKRTYDLSPQQVQNTEFFRRRIRKGELIAADSESAKLAGLKGFVEPAQAIENAKKAAIALFKADRGIDPPIEDWPSLVLLAETQKLPSVKDVMKREIAKASGFEGEAPPGADATAEAAEAASSAQAEGDSKGAAPPLGERPASSPTPQAPKADEPIEARVTASSSEAPVKSLATKAEGPKRAGGSSS